MLNVLLTAGLACLIGAIVGGGLKAFGLELPILASGRRQLLLGLLGLTLLAAVAIAKDYRPDPAATTPAAAAPAQSKPNVSTIEGELANIEQEISSRNDKIVLVSNSRAEAENSLQNATSALTQQKIKINSTDGGTVDHQYALDDARGIQATINGAKFEIENSQAILDRTQQEIGQLKARKAQLLDELRGRGS